MLVTIQFICLYSNCGAWRCQGASQVLITARQFRQIQPHFALHQCVRCIMYIPKHFDEPSLEILHQLMRARPLSTLVTLSSGGLNANHIPLHLSVEGAPLGTLRGHVARGNPLWCDVVKEVDVLAIFNGPEAYISPSWYPSKAETGRAVPTWNYAVAHAYGQLRVIDDKAWLRSHLAALTLQQESSQPAPWQLADAPGDYIDKMLSAVVGIEIDIVRLTGKWKMSQNQPAANQAGVVQGLRAAASPEGIAVAEIVEEIAARESGETR